MTRRPNRSLKHQTDWFGIAFVMGCFGFFFLAVYLVQALQAVP